MHNIPSNCILYMLLYHCKFNIIIDTCSYGRNGKPRRAAFYVRPEHWLRQLLEISKMAEHFDYIRQYVEDGKFRGEADDELRDFMDGSIFKDVVEPYIRANGAEVVKTVLCAFSRSLSKRVRRPSIVWLSLAK